MQRDRQFLLDMLQSAELIVQYIGDRPQADLTADFQLQDAVIRRLLIIAEAARRVSDVTRDSLPGIAWQEINGMRNRLVHEYDDVNLKIVWATVQDDIPTLIAELSAKFPTEA